MIKKITDILLVFWRHHLRGTICLPSSQPGLGRLLRKMFWRSSLGSVQELVATWGVARLERRGGGQSAMPGAGCTAEMELRETRGGGVRAKSAAAVQVGVLLEFGFSLAVETWS